MVATVMTPEVFKQTQATNAAHIVGIFSGSGYWTEKGEEVQVPLATPRATNKVTYTMLTFAKGIELSKEFWEDNMHDTWQKAVREFGDAGRETRNKTGFGLYRNAFTTTLTADGVSFIDTAHVLIGGGTQSNQVANNPPLDEEPLNSAIVQLQEMKSQDGVMFGDSPAVLLVPPKLRKKAQQLVESTLVSSNATNAVNVYSSTYGLKVFTSPHLGAAAGGSDTAWFLLSANHSVTRFSRQDIQTTLVGWEYNANNNFVYKGDFREQYGVPDYAGAVGSLGDGSAT
jgi:phage major head subunit gpT-like protein